MNDFSLLSDLHGRMPSSSASVLSGLSVSFGGSGGKGTGKRAKKGRERRGTAAPSPEKRRMPGAGPAGGGRRGAGWQAGSRMAGGEPGRRGRGAGTARAGSRARQRGRGGGAAGRSGDAGRGPGAGRRGPGAEAAAGRRRERGIHGRGPNGSRNPRCSRLGRGDADKNAALNGVRASGACLRYRRCHVIAVSVADCRCCGRVLTYDESDGTHR
jgi:hypothetical protein